MLKVVTGRTRTSGSELGGSRGFSLIELLVALVLLVAMLAVAPAYFSKGISSAEFRNSAREIAAGLRATQAQAISRFQERVFQLDLEERLYSTDGMATTTALPADLVMTLKTAESERNSETEGGIRFFPDGSSTGGEIKLTNEGNSLRVAVNWATGRVTIVAGE